MGALLIKVIINKISIAAFFLLSLFFYIFFWGEGALDKADVAYDNGNYMTAFQKLLPLAEQGNPIAQFNIGFMYSKGQGVVQNDSKAAFWFQKSASQGFPQAQFAIGLIYEYKYYHGESVTDNLILAHMLFNLAAVNGDPKYINSRDRVAEHLTQFQISRAQNLAEKWKIGDPIPTAVEL